MKILTIALNFFIVLLCSGCAVKKINYNHVVFDEVPALKVIDRSYAPEKDSKGNLIKNQIMNLPTRLQLNRSEYMVDILVPANAEPVVFISIISTGAKKITLSGPHIIQIKGDHPYSFLVADAKGSPLRIEITDESGKNIGVETLSYKIVNRCHTYAIDAL